MDARALGGVAQRAGRAQLMDGGHDVLALICRFQLGCDALYVPFRSETGCVSLSPFVYLPQFVWLLTTCRWLHAKNLFR